MMIVSEIAVVVVTQVTSGSIVTTQLTLSPLFNVVLLYVGELLPTLALFIFHWYIGVDPVFRATALKITGVPEQTTVELVLMSISGTSDVETSTWIVFDRIVCVDMQIELSEYSQLTRSPLLRVVNDKVLPVATLIPFTRHWKKGAVPPFNSELLKIAVLPEQKLVEFAAIVNVGCLTGFTRRITVSITMPPATIQDGTTSATQIKVSLFAKLEAV
jgi:hypothetical protein